MIKFDSPLQLKKAIFVCLKKIGHVLDHLLFALASFACAGLAKRTLASNVKQLMDFVFIFRVYWWAKRCWMKKMWAIWCLAESTLHFFAVYVQHAIFFILKLRWWWIATFNFDQRHLFINDLDANFTIIQRATGLVVFKLWGELILLLSLIENGDTDAWRETSCGQREGMLFFLGVRQQIGRTIQRLLSFLITLNFLVALFFFRSLSIVIWLCMAHLVTWLL